MSYKIGQLRKLPKNSFEDVQNISEERVETPYGEHSKDGALACEFKKGEVYYFKLDIRKYGIKKDIPYKIKLKDKDGNYQSLELRKFKKDGDTADIVELIFIPKYDFQYMVFEAQRTTEYVDDINAYFQCLQIYAARRLFNLIGSEFLPEGIVELARVGVQGPVGLSFAINGEKITLGKSRMFTSPEMSIKSIAFLVNPSYEEENIDFQEFIGKENQNLLYDSKNFFVMDYQYNEGVMIYE